MIDAHSEFPSLCHGAQPEALQTLPTLTQVLRNATQTPKELVYVHSDGGDRRQTYRELEKRSQQLLASIQQAGAQPGDRIILQIQDPLDLLAGIWACWLGEFVAVPIGVPLSYAADNGKAMQLRSALEIVEASLVVVSQANLQTVRDFLGAGDRVASLESLQIHNQSGDGIPDNSQLGGSFASDRLALILFTSGSTGKPKGVMLTERNLLVSACGMATVNGLTERSITLNWMPLEHVASLVMFHLTEVLVGCQQIHVANDYVLQDALRWLDLCDRFRVTATWAPNFAYGLVGDRQDEIAQRTWDLSCIEWMGNGAEAVVAKTSRTFLQLLTPHGLASTAVSPGYGMSETCSGIVHSDRFSLETISEDVPFVEVGTPIPGVSLRIVDEQQNLLPEGAIGLLQVKGLTVTSGYYARPELDAEIFTPDGWFNTGDLGFLKDGHLTITGRQKDVIILNGANFYSHEIEAVVEELPEVEVSYTAACGVRWTGETTDKLAIFLHPVNAEIDLKLLIKAVRRQVVNRLGIRPEYVIPVERAEIPKTAIGKIQRSQLVQQLQAGRFSDRLCKIAAILQNNAPAQQPRNQIERELVEIWRSQLNLQQIGIEEHFFELGGDSLRLVQVLHQLQQRGYTLTVMDLFQHATIASLAKFLSQSKDAQANSTISQAVIQGQQRAQRRRQVGSDGIAVIGMACRFPGANSVEEFWQNLRDGVESITFFSDQELLAAGVEPHLVQHPDYVKASPILGDIESFDASFFGYSPREAELLDPQQRLMLECAWEALEDAGYDPLTFAETGGAIALYAGASMNTYLLNHVYPNRDRLDNHDSLRVVTLSSMGGFQLTIANDKDYLTTRVSYKLNLTGASVNVQTACSTSLVAVHMACQDLLRGESDLALAGGVSVHTPQKSGHLFQEGMILTPDGHCRAFDAQAKGTIFGSGAGIVVLKRLEEAIADGDQIYAVVKGSAMGNDGSQKVGYLAPRAEGQATVISEALAIAEFEPDSVSYVEAHGTGTELGDPIEISALTQAFRSGTDRNQYCAIGSVKTNVGHLNIASGVVGFIKTALALHHKQIPPSLHFETPNPQIDFANSPFFVNTILRDWQTSTSPRRAGVNSLGIGGTNVHVFLQEAPLREAPATENERPLHLLTLSAKDATALQELADRYIQLIESHPEIPLTNLCFTANVGRSHFSHRLAIVTDSLMDAKTQLQSWKTSSHQLSHHPNRSRPFIAFVFPGQGSHDFQMGRQLYETQPVFREAIARCNELLQSDLGFSLQELLYSDAQFSAELLQQTAFAQPALFALEVALVELWRSWGIRPDGVMGHSLGEYVAAWVAGVFSLEDALKLVMHRSRLMQAQPPGKMAAIFADVEQVRSHLAEMQIDLAIAAINSPQNTVISGGSRAIEQAIAQFQQQGITSKLLAVSHAFHSPQMEPILDEFRAIAQTVRFSPPTLPLVANLTGTLAEDDIATVEYWCQQLCQPVQFAAGVKQLQQMGCEVVVECGARPTFAALWHSSQEETATPQSDASMHWLTSLNPKQSDWSALLNSLKELYLRGITVDWAGFDRPYLRRRISLPTYPFQRQRYWLEAKPAALATTTSSATIHPLLGQKIATPKAILFDVQLRLEELAYLKDHRIYGAIVFPGSAYLEMAIAAATVLFPTTSIQFENVVIHQVMQLTEVPLSIQISITRNDNHSSFEIYSCRVEDESSWTLHCSGTIITLISEPIEFPNLAQLQRQFTLNISWPDILASLPGIEYGATFRGVQQVWRSPNSALGLIKLPYCLKDSVDSYQIHPALLDACLQVVLAFAPTHSVPFLPVSCDRLHYFERPSEQVWSYIEIKHQTSEVLIADVTLFNESGKVALAIAGLTAKAVSAKALGLTPDWSNWLHTLKWQPTSLSVDASESASDVHWLIFADSQGIAHQLIHQLSHIENYSSNHQRSSLTVVAQSKTNQSLDQEIQIDPACAEEFVQVVRSLQKIDSSASFDNAASPKKLRQRALRVVYLWGLDATDATEILAACTSALYLTQALMEASCEAELWFVTQGSQALNIQKSGWVQAALWGLGRAIALETSSIKCRCVDLDENRVSSTNLLLDELQANDSATQITIRNGMRYVAQLTPCQTPGVLKNTHCLFPKTPLSYLQLQIAERGSLDQLEWRSQNRRNPQPDEIELRVLTAGLNFRDVLNVLGRYPGEAGAPGLECVGEVVAVGAAVSGFALGDIVLAIAPGCFAEFVTVKANLAIRKPPSVHIVAAATLPTAFLTAAYALQRAAHLRRGDRILIHAAAGGVGLAAVQLAQQIGAEIYATASPAKWPYLQQMGIRYVYNSRSLDFVEAIRSDTDGAGVDVVLNSLSGDFITKSASLLRDGGRFVEIGKPDTVQIQSLQQIYPTINHHLIDLMNVTEQHPDQVQMMFRHIMQQIETGLLQPLPYQVFERDRMVEAFRYMQQAKQIGKIVIEFVRSEFSIQPDGVYLVTGGLGGIGLSVAQALIDWGAKHLLLIGRNAPNSEAAQLLQQWRSHDIEIITAPLDIADLERVTHFFKQNCPVELRKLRGVFHAAGVLEDEAIANQTRESFERVMAPKIQGAWNLHELTKELPLDCFVLFSSAASLLGSAGQVNYAAANAGMDALAHWRRSLGLPAISINWGLWAKVGMATRLPSRSQFEAKGMQTIDPEIGLEILKTVLSESSPQVGVIPFIRTQLSPETAITPSSKSLLEVTWIEQLNTLSECDRPAALIQQVRQIVGKVLGLEPARIEPNQGFSDLGMDSLTSTELSHQLQKNVGRPLPTTLLYNYPTLETLTEYLMQLLELKSNHQQREAIATKHQISSTINGAECSGVEQLSDVEAEALLLDELDRLNL